MASFVMSRLHQLMRVPVFVFPELDGFWLSDFAVVVQGCWIFLVKFIQQI